MKPAIFLDRDGVIIENRSSYVRSWADVSFYPQALHALATINNLPYLVVIVTNQSPVGRGIISIENAVEINRRIAGVIIESGGRIDAIYMCPHAPLDHCECRKPKPGLILKATYDLSIDLNNSVLVGDSLSDLSAAHAAGVGSFALVRTGRGKTQARLPAARQFNTTPIYNTLAEALGDLLK